MHQNSFSHLGSCSFLLAFGLRTSPAKASVRSCSVHSPTDCQAPGQNPNLSMPNYPSCVPCRSSVTPSPIKIWPSTEGGEARAQTEWTVAGATTTPPTAAFFTFTRSFGTSQAQAERSVLNVSRLLDEGFSTPISPAQQTIALKRDRWRRG